MHTQSQARNLMLGIAAGASGTVALNVVTYLDMLVRGRGASDVPSNVAGELADRSGIAHGASHPERESTKNRLSGAGALFGYMTGLGVGALYGAVRPHARALPVPLAGVGLGGLAMLGSDVPATALGVTSPKEWGRSAWASDIVPHLAYGLVTALAFEQFTRR